MYEVDLVEQAAVHLPDQHSGRLHSDHKALLCEVQPQHRRTDFGCGKKTKHQFILQGHTQSDVSIQCKHREEAEVILLSLI